MGLFLYKRGENVKISKEGIVELANYECLTLKPYLDSGGVKTVGIGSTSSDIKDLAKWDWDKELTIQEAIDLYVKGLQKYDKAVSDTLKVPVTQNEYDALVSITYNIGIGGMQKSTFMKLVNARANKHDIVNAMARWNKDNGKVVKGLVNRRAKEADLFLNSDYKSGGKVPLTPVINKKPVYSQAKRIDMLGYL